MYHMYVYIRVYVRRVREFFGPWGLPTSTSRLVLSILLFENNLEPELVGHRHIDWENGYTAAQGESSAKDRNDTSTYDRWSRDNEVPGRSCLFDFRSLFFLYRGKMTSARWNGEPTSWEEKRGTERRGRFQLLFQFSASVFSFSYVHQMPSSVPSPFAWTFHLLLVITRINSTGETQAQEDNISGIAMVQQQQQ